MTVKKKKKTHPTGNGTGTGVQPWEGVIATEGLQSLIDALRARGYRVLGPRALGGAIVYDEITARTQLPAGWLEEQGPGSYQLQPGGDGAFFRYTVGPHSWKRFLSPPRRRLWQAERTGDGQDFTVQPEADTTPPQAFLGVRACELAALAVQDRVFMEGPYADPVYTARRRAAFVIAVNCTRAASTCFCTSMDTGPAVQPPYDLALTELLDETRHHFFVEAGSDRGAEVLADLPARPATEADQAEARRVVEATAATVERTLETAGLHDLLLGNLDHPGWDAVAERCLACGNCTMVCPTCFCSTVEDVTDLSGRQAERWQTWDSCFTMDFSYIHGGSVRGSVKARYRQWLTHKLASWIDQFGTSGCVGCGRCITWCPVGIDLTETVRILRENPLPTVS